MENLCINGVIGFEPGEVRDLYSLGPSSMGYGHGYSEGYGDMIFEGTGSGKSAGYGLEWKDLLPSGCGYGTSTGAGGFTDGHTGWGYGVTGGTYNNEI